MEQETQVTNTAASKISKFFRIFKDALLCVILISSVIVGALVYKLYNERDVKFVTDERPCKLMVGDTEVTGFRTYRYKHTTIGNFRFIDVNEIEEKTTVNVRGSGFVVIGMTGDNWEHVRVGQGEIGVKVVKNFDNYTFVFENAVNSVPYSKFCK